MFTDSVILDLHAGKGGNGVVAWRREKYIPKGGPCGGCGGKGGDVVVVADIQIPSLDWYRNRKILKAENGVQGGANKRRGRNGKELLLKVPCGTLVKDAQSGEILADMTDDGQKWVVCVGGKGGRGNETFKSSINRAPNFCTPGKPGGTQEIELELKLIADVGLVGFPNAGKSTLIKRISRARVKTAPYPFTTLRPNLGYVELEDYSRVLIADIPGIIAGAHEDRGLGFEFLRHIERTKLLVFVLDSAGTDGRDPLEDYRTLRRELESYNPDLVKRPYIVLLNKIDVEDSQLFIEQFLKEEKLPEDSLLCVSAERGDGLKDFVAAVSKRLGNELI